MIDPSEFSRPAAFASLWKTKVFRIAPLERITSLDPASCVRRPPALADYEAGLEAHEAAARCSTILTGTGQRKHS
jgi:hypothetical protein